tara:strand:+ start:2125 stop:3138 length:1014 start_codon:yes stop_codon:yes gene_type:complete
VKLSTYFEKPAPAVPKDVSRRIVVSNDGVKKKFLLQIHQLEGQITALQDSLLKEQTAEQALRGVYRSTSEELRIAQDNLKKFDNTSLENAQLQTRIKEVEALKDIVPELEKTLQKERLTLNEIRTEHGDVVKALETTQTLLGEAKDRAARLDKEAREHKYRADVLEEKYPVEQAQRQQALAQTKELEKTKDSLEADVDELSRNFFYWRDKAEILNERLDAESKLRDEIKISLDAVSHENRLESKKVTKSGEAYKKAQQTILDLQNRNIDLTKFADQLSKIILEQKKSFVSMGRMSQGAIGIKEGFNMPFAKENIRKVYLGNAAPTMLKFKEITHDNS